MSMLRHLLPHASTLRNFVMTTLSMREAVVIGISPDKRNIEYAIVFFISLEQAFCPMIDKLTKGKLEMGCIILFFPTFNHCSKLYFLWKSLLGSVFLYPSDAPDLSRFRLVELFTACNEFGRKDQNIKSFYIIKFTV